MRKGSNPAKDKEVDGGEFIHQVIIPVYIPKQSGYYKDSFSILKLCLTSLWKTIHKKTFITVVNNGSCATVADYLDELLKEELINELIHTPNIGKVNAVIKGLVGFNSPIVTISDADVLFLTGWQDETYKIFHKFHKAGVVGLTPQFKLFKSKSANTILDNLFSRGLKFSIVQNPNALRKFYKSIGWEDDYNKDYLRYNLSLEKEGVTALVGSGHFVSSYRRQVFKEIEIFKNARLGIDSEDYLDGIPLKYGLWRLTTERNYAYHLGNVKEIWMQEKIKELKSAEEKVQILDFSNVAEVNKFSFFLKSRLFQKLLSLPVFEQLLYKFTSLPKDVRKSY